MNNNILIIATFLVASSSITAQNVGIGVTNPIVKLDVNGDIYMRGDDLYMSYDGATNSNNDYMSYNDLTPPNLGSVGVFHFHADAVRGQAWDMPTATISANGAYFSGRVGIGIAAPTTITQLSNPTAGDAILRLEADTDNAGSEDDNPRIELNQDGGLNSAMIGFYDGNNNSGNVFRIGLNNSGTRNWSVFSLNVGTKNIGIGTSSATEKLDIVGGGIQLNSIFGIGFIGDIPYDGNVSGDRAKIYFGYVIGSPYDFLVFEKTDMTQNDPDGGMTFMMKGSDNISERVMTIRGNNRIGIGSISNPSYALELPNSATVGVGRARANAWVTYSDGRIKESRKPLSYGLATVLKMNPLEYQQHDSNHDAAGNVQILKHSTKEIGFIAQEMQKLIPEIVYQPADEQKDLWSVDYTRLIPVLTKAIQEQKLSIEETEKTFSSLQTELNLLKTK